MDNSKALVAQTTDIAATWAEVQDMGKAFFASGMFSDIKSQAQAVVKIVAGRELGLPAIYSMQNINLIRNRLCTSANTLALLVKRSGRYNYRMKEHTDEKCAIAFFENDAGKWIEVGDSTFTIQDAKRANLIQPDSGWVKYPRAMLFSRAISQGARIYCPDAIGGMYTDEEIRSIPSKPGVEVMEGSFMDSGTPEISHKAKVKGPSTTSDTTQEPTGAMSTIPEGKDLAKRDPTTVKTLNDLMKACHQDFSMQPKEVLAELGVSSQAEIAEAPESCYTKISAVRK